MEYRCGVRVYVGDPNGCHPCMQPIPCCVTSPGNRVLDGEGVLLLGDELLEGRQGLAHSCLAARKTKGVARCSPRAQRAGVGRAT